MFSLAHLTEVNLVRGQPLHSNAGARLFGGRAADPGHLARGKHTPWVFSMGEMVK